MKPEEKIRISRDELFNENVEKVIERQRTLQQKLMVPDNTEVSPLRRLLMSSMFYFPLAGLLGALVTCLILEPTMHDLETIGGEVVLIGGDTSIPTGTKSFNGRTITVGSTEVVYFPGVTTLEPGGRRAGSVPGVRAGTRGVPRGHWNQD